MTPVRDPLRHHGDTEAGTGLLDFAVNVYAGGRRAWLDRALHAAIDQAASYPDAGPARAAIARRPGLSAEEVLATAGAAEAFTLIARLASAQPLWSVSVPTIAAMIAAAKRSSGWTPPGRASPCGRL